jgi:hypothetical protein
MDRSIYESKFAFRLIYNGEVITQKMDGCLEDAELCDIKVFLKQVSPMATRKRDCGQSSSVFTSWTQAGSRQFSGPFYTFCMILIGVACGVAGTFYYLTGSLPWMSMVWNRRTTRITSHGISSSGTSTTSNRNNNIPPVSFSDEPYSDDPVNEKDGITLMN